jgi:transcriptional regulator with GAF, ATPase, and Fis domain
MRVPHTCAANGL